MVARTMAPKPSDPITSKKVTSGERGPDEMSNDSIVAFTVGNAQATFPEEIVPTRPHHMVHPPSTATARTWSTLYVEGCQVTNAMAPGCPWNGWSAMGSRIEKPGSEERLVIASRRTARASALVP